MSPKAQWIGKFYLILFGSMIFLGAAFKRIRGILEADSLLTSFNNREIATAKVPVEVRFITHELTLQAVIDRVGNRPGCDRCPSDPDR